MPIRDSNYRFDFTMDVEWMVLKERKLPEIQYRIGIDSGEAMITTVGDVSAKQHKDLIGETINLAAKIQAVAKPNEIAIGDTTLRNLFVERRLPFKPYRPEGWNYKTKDGSVYPIHSIV